MGLRGTQALRVFLCFAAGYLLSYGLRSVNAVIAPALLLELGLSNGDLGLLSAAYFLSFAGLQLPLGIWLDRYGPRKTESALLLFAALGCAIFASSSSLLGLWVGRALIGVGVSACLMASFKAYRLWFAPEQQSRLASWMLVAGTSGALSATVPVSMAMPFIGWRGIFWVVCGLILAVAAMLFFLLKKVEASHDAGLPAAVAGSPGEGYRRIFCDPYFRRMALLGLVNQGIFVALQTLWAGPWMITVLGMSKDQSAQILFAFNFTLMLGYVSLAWWAPRYISLDGKSGLSVARAVGIGLFGTLVTQAAILFISAPWAWLLWLLLALFITVATLIQTHVSLSFPARLAGRSNTAYNLLLFIGAFLAQWGIGAVIDFSKAHGASGPDALRIAFGLCLALQSAALLAFVLNRAQAGRAD